MFDLSAYYRHSQMADGHLNFCKSCVKRRISNERNQNIEAHRLRDAVRYYASAERQASCQKYSKTAGGKASHLNSTRAYNKRNPEKAKARNAVNNAIRDGRLHRQPCEICGAVAQAHHDDYSKPLDVKWRCTKHHLPLEHRKHTEAVRLALAKRNVMKGYF